MKCPKCNNEMENLGNIDGSVFCTYPASWLDTYICRTCKVKTTKHVSDEMPPSYEWIDSYKLIKGNNNG